MRVKDVADFLSAWAPPIYAESYDNPGLLVGDPQAVVTGVLVSLDCTEAVVRDALSKGCNMVVSHHPIVFKGLKRLTGASYVERTVMLALREGVALYAIHTNLDHIHTGVNHRLANELGLEQVRILRPKTDALRKLTFFVPPAAAEAVRQAVYAAGAGRIGHYADCSFNTYGVGTFTPTEGANPTEGQVGVPSTVQEVRVEVLVEAHAETGVLHAMRQAHPYEEVAFYLSPLLNAHQQLGAGMVGKLARPMSEQDFLEHLKRITGCGAVRHTAFRQMDVQTVAFCGGSGSFLLGDAMRAGADVYVSADFKYHEFFDAEGRILIADVGHYESEQFTINLIAEKLAENFSTFATRFTKVNTNPIHYF
jgi:dinuclear metal center YbgI/SA1388 family protein